MVATVLRKVTNIRTEQDARQAMLDTVSQEVATLSYDVGIHSKFAYNGRTVANYCFS